MASSVGSGYSGTPLVKKLGIASTTVVCMLNPPAGYIQLIDPERLLHIVSTPEKASLIHLFADTYESFHKSMEKLTPVYSQNTEVVIWVSWYKKSSGIKTDLTEDLIREYALSRTLVDIKVCAVTDLWSGIKLVVRKKFR